MEITQPTPRNIGRINTHNTNTIIEPVRMINTLTTFFFIWLKPELEVLPRLLDMLLFVFIVRHFFVYQPSVSVCSTLRGRVRQQRDVRPLA